jgi:hypothetical protein
MSYISAVQMFCHTMQYYFQKVKEAKNMDSSSNLPVGVGVRMRTVVSFDKKRSCSQGGDLEEKF